MTGHALNATPGEHLGGRHNRHGTAQAGHGGGEPLSRQISQPSPGHRKGVAPPGRYDSTLLKERAPPGDTLHSPVVHLSRHTHMIGARYPLDPHKGGKDDLHITLLQCAVEGQPVVVLARLPRALEVEQVGPGDGRLDTPAGQSGLQRQARSLLETLHRLGVLSVRAQQPAP